MIFGIVLLIIMGLAIISILVCLFLMPRNNKVGDERLRIVRICYSIALKEIHDGKYNDNKDYFKFLHEVSYDIMFYKIWKPVKSFYPEWLKKQNIQ
jgi:hypothetical protein